MFTPAWLYVCTREDKTGLRHLGVDPGCPVIMAASVFGLSVAWEIGQKIGLIRGAYDSLDILAYSVGIAAAVVIDRWLDGQTRTVSECPQLPSRAVRFSWQDRNSMVTGKTDHPVARVTSCPKGPSGPPAT